MQSSLLFQSPALIIVPALQIAVPLIRLATLILRLTTLLIEHALLFLLLTPLAQRFSLSFLIGTTSILLLYPFDFGTALVVLLPAKV